jgi:glucose/arabinose dehydrogenase
MTKRHPLTRVILGATLILTLLLGSIVMESRPVYASESVAHATGAAAATATLPSPDIQFNLVPIGPQFQQPVFAGNAGDGSGRLFVVEKAGTIRIVQDGALLKQPFLDISDHVNSSSGERGLLGLAFPPDFSQTGYFFVDYTDADGNTNVARFLVVDGSPNTADAASEFTVLRITQPASNHNGGMLAFGPDGYLYIGTGDGGGSYDAFHTAQDPQSLLGKMLRIDVTSNPSVPYVIPPDNPWVNVDLNGKDVLDEIWAMGLRNPWRFSFDRESGDLWIADVGQGAWEEVNLTAAGSPGGLNYGWPIMEGTHCVTSGCDTTGLVQPILEYGHVNGQCSISGGYVYRGTDHAALDGVYFYGDYCSGAIWVATQAAGGIWQSALAVSSGLLVSSFGEDEAGELYVTDLRDGGLYRIVLEYKMQLPLLIR